MEKLFITQENTLRLAKATTYATHKAKTEKQCMYFFNEPNPVVTLTNLPFQKGMKAVMLGSSKVKLQLSNIELGTKVIIPKGAAEKLKNVWVIKVVK